MTDLIGALGLELKPCRCRRAVAVVRRSTAWCVTGQERGTSAGTVRLIALRGAVADAGVPVEASGDDRGDDGITADRGGSGHLIRAAVPKPGLESGRSSPIWTCDHGWHGDLLTRQRRDLIQRGRWRRRRCDS